MGFCVSKEKAAAPNPVDENQYHHIFKIVILGDVNVGKSCVLLRYLQNVFTDAVATIGEDLQGTFFVFRSPTSLPLSHLLVFRSFSTLIAIYCFRTRETSS